MNLRCRNPLLVVAAVACLAMVAWSSSASAAELLGYWKFEETSVDQPAVDSSGKGLNGEYNEDVELGVEGAPGFGLGAYFNGVSSEVFLGPGDETGLGDLTSDFSMMAWINPEQFDHKNRVMGSIGGGQGWGWGTVGDSLEITTYGVKDYDQPVPLELEEWVHAAVVLDDNFDANFYLNGEHIGTQSHPSEGIPTLNDFVIGWSCVTTEYFEGRLDEVGVFSGALTEEQINNAMEFGVDKWETGGAGIAMLQAGDANMDLKFDQLDLVKVQVAAKYLTGQAATWGDGDWNGAPGGAQGSPPQGDGRFDQIDIIAALNANTYLKGPYAALAGAGTSADGQTSLVYNATTGELSVDPAAGKNLTSINIDSAASRFIGTKPAVLVGDFDNFGPGNVFKATFGSAFGAVSFGAVLPAGLDMNTVVADLSAVGSLEGGGALGAVDLVYVPEPTTVLLLTAGLVLLAGRTGRRSRA